ncbi:Hypothetical protein A7982_11690 [Minicystis rosea]|nr:Hypothetical protein A7982_11690 [Minicystis rosea]
MLEVTGGWSRRPPARGRSRSHAQPAGSIGRGPAPSWRRG